MRLKKRERCPLHGSFFCCGREKNSLKRDRGLSSGPVRRIPDEHHPRGYREICTAAELRRRTLKKAKDQKGICAWCHLPMTDVREIGPDHIEPRCMGAGSRDDHEDNLAAVHNACNREKGSRRFAVNSAGLYIVGEKQASNG